ncbi:dihydropteroate synthase [Symbiobacterium thermophilum]|uniref:Dihydropteroate synthase n=2 Tax=Symbiobacterium thermophilum TaxID=2734 RepID=Q67JI0_SYMTH|nr:dihydropteroate synthase [Symbiobacterium thermophilum]MBY6276442.1 dihydropteroate synthase [Symbiobacterium thermophilum]BAD42170.1 dihydropteroate synthase [Symbiobacterium thermophilum IAM 14863]
MWRISCRGRSLELGTRSVIMGILNVTPDSFSDGGRWTDPERAVARALHMLEEGADIIDIGGESTRPGYEPVPADEEMRRVLPVIAALRRAAPDAIISVDTQKAAVAEAALGAGADMINDIWGLQGDPEMVQVAARWQCPVVVMHNQHGTEYRELMGDIKAFFRRSLALAAAAGLPGDLIILDPGVGFGKTPLQNLEVIRRLGELRELDRPLLLGVSRKSTIGKVLGGLPPEERLEGTAAAVAIGIMGGADILRVHDVRAMKRVAQVADAIVRPGRGGFEG